MGLLLFKKVFAGPIVAGTKTTTLRRWNRPRCRAGQRVYAPGIGYLRVTAVQQIPLSSLTTADARSDGFGSVTALRKTLRSLYSPGQSRRPLFKVSFVFERVG